MSTLVNENKMKIISKISKFSKGRKHIEIPKKHSNKFEVGKYVKIEKVKE